MKKVVFACATMMMASSLMAADGVSELKAEISRLKAQYEADPNVKTPVIRIYTGGDSPSLIRLPDIYDEGQ